MSTRITACAALAALLCAGCHLIFRFDVSAAQDAAPDVVAVADLRTGDIPAVSVDGPEDMAPPDGPALDGGPVQPDVVMTSEGSVAPTGWAALPGGSFMMGSSTTDPCAINNEDVHQVTLTHGFMIQTTEVTQGQFAALMGYNPSHYASCGASCPVERVSWHEAAAYCNALSDKETLAVCYTCVGSGPTMTCQEAATYSGQNVYACPGYRLPTEAEWEYAYRAGTTTPFYSGPSNGGTCTLCGQDVAADPIGWHCGNAGNQTHPAGQKQANAWGLHDMGGNVWELCHDWYQANLGTSSAKDPWGPASGSSRVGRGGSFINQPRLLRAAAHSSFSPSVPFGSVGFRCVRTLTP